MQTDEIPTDASNDKEIVTILESIPQIETSSEVVFSPARATTTPIPTRVARKSSKRLDFESDVSKKPHEDVGNDDIGIQPFKDTPEKPVAAFKEWMESNVSAIAPDVAISQNIPKPIGTLQDRDERLAVARMEKIKSLQKQIKALSMNTSTPLKDETSPAAKTSGDLRQKLSEITNPERRAYISSLINETQDEPSFSSKQNEGNVQSNAQEASALIKSVNNVSNVFNFFVYPNHHKAIL